MTTDTVAILGANSAIGWEMLRLLQARNFPVETLLPLDTDGGAVIFRGKRIPVHPISDYAFTGADLVLGASDGDTARRFAPAIARAGAVFVDSSPAFRLEETVPLVVPEVNPADIQSHRGIIASPNGVTTIALTAIAPLQALSPIRSVQAVTCQAVSGAGAAGPVELTQQVFSLTQGESPMPRVFPHPIAYNLIPRIGPLQEQGYTAEEMRLQYEGRRILHLPEFAASCTCIRVPVVRSHSICATVCFEKPVSADEARTILENAPGCRLLDDLPAEAYPMPLYASDQDGVQVGRIRPDLTDANRLCLWCCGDQLRKGSAANVLQIAELLLPEAP